MDSDRGVESGYELLDTGDGLRLERFALHTVVRPDPNVLWKKSNPGNVAWQQPDARFLGRNEEENWQLASGLENGWLLTWGAATFRVKPTPFRHMGLFPEQAVQWQWLQEGIARFRQANGRAPRVLNAFAYTGAASVVAALAGAEVCHLDASAGSINWAKENARLSGLPEDAIRWIVDDARKFLQREVRRSRQYDLILMDPPVFGRGPKGEVWRLENGLPELSYLAGRLMSPEPLGFWLNFYATALYPESVLRLFQVTLPFPLSVAALQLEEKYSKKNLQTGFCLRS